MFFSVREAPEPHPLFPAIKTCRHVGAQCSGAALGNVPGSCGAGEEAASLSLLLYYLPDPGLLLCVCLFFLGGGVVGFRDYISHAQERFLVVFRNCMCPGESSGVGLPPALAPQLLESVLAEMLISW